MTRRLLTIDGARSRWQAASAAALLAVGLSACQVASPITTDLIYDPGDGVSAHVGGLLMRDLLVVSEGRGAPGAVLGVAVNPSNEPIEVTVAIVDAGTPAEPSTVDAGGPPRPEVPSEADLAALEAANASFSLTREVARQRHIRLDGAQTPVPGTEQIPAIIGDTGLYVTLQLESSDGGLTTVSVPVLAPCGDYEGIVEAQFPEACGWDRQQLASEDH